MTLEIRRLGRTFAAEARGLDLRRSLTADEVEAIEQALADNGVLVFRKMLLNDDQQQAFIERFGPPSEVKLDELKSAKSAHPHFFDVTTVPEDLVMWDDTWTMHRAVPYEGDEPRVLRWSGVREVAPV